MLLVLTCLDIETQISSAPPDSFFDQTVYESIAHPAPLRPQLFMTLAVEKWESNFFITSNKNVQKINATEKWKKASRILGIRPSELSIVEKHSRQNDRHDFGNYFLSARSHCLAAFWENFLKFLTCHTKIRISDKTQNIVRKRVKKRVTKPSNSKYFIKLNFPNS